MAVSKANPSSPTVIKPNRRGTVTIPKEFRATWDEETTVLEVVLRDDGVIELRPRALIDPARMASYAEWERREAFFGKWQSIAEQAGVESDEADELAAEAIVAARQATQR